MSNQPATKPHRDTIYVEDAEVISQDAYPGEQFILRVRAPQVARDALPGSFAHLQCDPTLPMRRPLSIMRVERKTGVVEFLYKAVGRGTQLLSRRTPGESLSLMGPIGVPFTLSAQRSRPLLMGGGVGIPPMVFLADAIRQNHPDHQPLVLMGSEVPFPFPVRPSQMLVAGVPNGVIAAMPLMEDWGYASRLASLQGFPGCFDGYITDLARHWLKALDSDRLKTVEIYACGPHPMLEATVKLAKEFDLPCQVSLEEFMACAVGGCAGCTVRINAPSGPAMKRVCVDGPVFNGFQVEF